MFETLNNPLCKAAIGLGVIVVIIIICQLVIATWRIYHVRPGKPSEEQLEAEARFNARHRA